MRVALLSPLPPSRSGIADYSHALSESLRRLAPLDVFAGIEGLPDLSAYDAVIYQIGNNHAHEFVYREALSHPGIVVLHEANLHYLVADMTIKRGDWDAYLREVEYDGGATALANAAAVRRLEVGPDYDGVPMLKRLLRRARGLIVHSEYVAAIARREGYSGPVAVIPHGAWLPEPGGAAWRERLGVTPEQPLLGIFGHLKPYKRIAESLRAFRRLTRKHPEARLILVGEPHPDFPVERLLDTLDLREQARVIGFAPIEEFVGYLDACDIVLNLRFPTVGESSGTMLRAMGLGKPVLVSDVGAFAEFPDEVCLKVPVGGPAEEDLLFAYLTFLVEDSEAGAGLGAAAREWVARECNWDCVAERYLAFCAAMAGLGPVAVAAGGTGEDARGTEAEPGKTVEAFSPASPVEAGARAPVEEVGILSTGSITGVPDASASEPELAIVGVQSAGKGTEDPASAPPLQGADIGEPAPGERAGADARGSAAGDATQGTPDLSTLDHPLAQDLLCWAENDAARQYLIQHLSRLVTTLEMLPEGAQDRSILEMGCYMQITPALRECKHYGAVRGCYYGKLGESVTKSARALDGREFGCVVDAFDAERDRYPYEDGAFDVVLCTELFEHLGHDPMHCLAEIQRVLKPGGRLLLSTPNACSLRAIAAVLGNYHPGFFPAFMRPGADGEVDPRHHREYAPREIRMALENAGFTVEQLRTAPYWSTPEPEHEWVRHLLDRYQLDATLRDECVFALASKTGEVRNRYPDWLYYG